jgi:hypothetical protein
VLYTYYDIERFKFGDIVQHWGRERLVHDVLISRELARGIIREGLRFESVEPKWTKPTETFRGYPLVGYSARQNLPPIIIRAEALEHLLSVEREDKEPELIKLHSEYVTKDDFRQWLVHTGKKWPEFWFDQNERYAKA